MPSSWFYFLLLSFIFIYPTSSSSSSSSSLSYTKHCSSIVPESSTTTRSTKNPLPHLSTPYITGGDGLLRRNPTNQTYVHVTRSLKLRLAQDYYNTIAAGTYKVEGILLIRYPYRYYDDGARGNYTYGGSYYRRTRARGSIRFSLNGFWSESSRKLCMVGSGSYDDAWGKTVNLDAVLRLKFSIVNNPTVYTGVDSGVLESTSPSSNDDPSYFDPILIFNFPTPPNYIYSFVSKEGFSSDFNVRKNQSLAIESNKFCPVTAWRSMFLELEYAVECKEEHHSHCSPLANENGVFLNSLPRILYLNPFHCSEDERMLRYTATFRNITYADQSFNLDSSLIGEASWDNKSNSLVGVACRLLNPLSHFGDAIGDCKMRLNLWYPSLLSIRNDARIVGQIWSLKGGDDYGFFKKIDLTSSDENGVGPFPGPVYEYTEMGRVRKSCERKGVKKGGGNAYPDGYSYNMKFDMSITDTKGEQIAWGYATPTFVGNVSYIASNMVLAVDTIAPQAFVEADPILIPANITNTSPVNISYKISINPFHPSLMNLGSQVEINAEGVYDGETGQLCMVGCRKMVNNLTISKDCMILLNFQFAPLNARGGLIKGTIESTRPKTDPLHFYDMITRSAAYYTEEAEKSLWRMDIEITLVLISNTLAFIFIALQILHVKRNPEVASFVSLFMLVILSIGHMIPLVLNFDAVFLGIHNKQTLVLSNGGRIEANEVTVRVITMVAFLLQIRLLQLVYTAKTSETNEKKAGFLSLALYICGALFTLLLNWVRNRYVSISPYQRYSIWGDFRSYAGLILDGFLLPQILLNHFIGSAEKALSGSFYIGTSAVRLVPHAYNQYRVHNYPKFDMNSTYYYANPAADFYSTAWDIVIPCGVFVLAVIVFVQQKHGGRCVLPQRFRGMLEMYEKVAVVDHA